MSFPDKFISYLYNFFLENKLDLCFYCKHNIVCQAKNCDKYENFGPATSMIVNGIEKPCTDGFNLCCMDLDFGTCNKLIGTPCETCFDNNNSGFEWSGTIPTDYKTF